MSRNVQTSDYLYNIVSLSEEHYQYAVELTFKLSLDLEFLSFDLAHSAIV